MSKYDFCFFVAVALGLSFCVGCGVSLLAESGGNSPVVVHGFLHCCSFSSCEEQALDCSGFSSCVVWA